MMTPKTSSKSASTLDAQKKKDKRNKKLETIREQERFIYEKHFHPNPGSKQPPINFASISMTSELTPDTTIFIRPMKLN